MTPNANSSGGLRHEATKRTTAQGGHSYPRRTAGDRARRTYLVPRCSARRAGAGGASENGRARRAAYEEIDHCCRGFERVETWLLERSILVDGRVGRAPSRLMHARDVVETVTHRLQQNPVQFLCPRGSGCAECDEAWCSVTER